MREDMDKVMNERPRHRGRSLNFPRGRRGYRIGEDELPRRQGIHRPWGGSWTSRTENVAPLRRYLMSNCGRPWDNVYSGICEQVAANSPMRQMFREQVALLVCTAVAHVDGKFLDSRGESIREPYLVDPRSGLLRRNEHVAKRRDP